MNFLNCVFMDRAFELAKKGLNTTMPNPRVGCVIVADGKIVGEGYHRRAGQDHAEIIAMKSAGERVRNSSMYITLEPCSFEGKTGPCTDEILRSGIREVIVASKDPNPRVAGKGLAKLKKAGVSVSMREDFKQSFELNPGFFKRMRTGLPWVRVKIAKSLDGYIALKSGESKWITGTEAREDGHRWRARSCCILTGSQTIRADNPLLTVRVGDESFRNPIKVIVDPNLVCDTDSKVFAEGKTILVTLNAKELSKFDKIKAMKDKNIDVIQLPCAGPSLARFSLKLLLMELTGQECNEVQVEAGPGLVTSLFKEKLIDEFLIYQSPKILGKGLSFIDKANERELLKRKSEWSFKDVGMIGDDLRMVLRNNKYDNPSFK